MPSVISLRKGEYYAHPQNCFWWILASTYGFSNNQSYAERCVAIKQAGVAIWDVLYDCERPGSADSDIRPGSQVVNNFDRFFNQQQQLRLIAFNGQTAQKTFMRYCSELSSKVEVDTVCLPSTSPAYAAMPREEKLRVWKTQLQKVRGNNG